MRRYGGPVRRTVFGGTLVAALVVGASCNDDTDREDAALRHGCNFVTTAWNAARDPFPPVAEAVSLARIARLAGPLAEDAAAFRDAAVEMAGDARIVDLYGSEPPLTEPDVDPRARERMEAALDNLVATCEDHGIPLNADLGGPRRR